MIVIATNNGKNHLIELLSVINVINPECGVSIIDTQSNDEETIKFLNELDEKNPYRFKLQIHQTPYRGFDSGAYMYAINNIKAERFYFIQDSIRIKTLNFFKNIDSKLKPGTVVPLITFPANTYDSQEQIDFCLNNFGKAEFSQGIFGPMFAIMNEDAQKIDKKHLVWPTNKMLQMGLERGWGVLFDMYGINIDPLEGAYDYYRLINDQYTQFRKIINYRA
jgi:hypothetical protein